jgi:hypothetical protein
MLFKILFLGLIWLITFIDLIMANHKSIKLRALILSIPISISLVVIFEAELASITRAFGLGRSVDAIIYITLFFLVRLIILINIRIRKLEILQQNIVSEFAKQSKQIC